MLLKTSRVGRYQRSVGCLERQAGIKINVRCQHLKFECGMIKMVASEASKKIFRIYGLESCVKIHFYVQNHIKFFVKFGPGPGIF